MIELSEQLRAADPEPDEEKAEGTSQTKCTVLLRMVTAEAVFAVTFVKKRATLEFVISREFVQEEPITRNSETFS
jgi:hypothetical protein